MERSSSDSGETEDETKKWDWLDPPTAYLLLPPYEPGDRNDRILLRRARIDLKTAILEKQKEEMLEEPTEKPKTISSKYSSSSDSPRDGRKTGKLTGAQIAEAAKAKVEEEKIDKVGSQYIELDPVQEISEKIEEYVQQSLDFYDHFMNLADEGITNVQVAVESRFRENCENGMDNGDRIMKELNDKAKELDEEYKKLTKDWVTSSKGLLPQELYSKLLEQEKVCDDFLENGETFKGTVKRMIEEGDRNLMELSILIDRDLSLMSERIMEKFAFENELRQLETQKLNKRLEEEFELMAKENHDELMGLIDDYTKLENEQLDEVLELCADTFENRMERKQKKKERGRRQLKEMDDDIQAFRMLLSGLESAILQNVQNLEFNLWVLKKRNMENTLMLNPLQRINLRLEERLRRLKKAAKDLVESSEKKYKLRLAKIAKLRRRCAEILPRHLHIASANYRKFMDLWVFNEEEIRDDIKEILVVEKYIKENYLGLGVVDPDLTILDQRPVEVQRFMDGEKKAAERRKISRKPSLFEMREFNNTLCDSIASDGSIESMTCNGRTPSIRTGQPSQKPPNILKDYSPFVIKGLMKYIAKIVCDQSPFLIEQQIRQVMAPMITKESTLVRISTVLEALNVTDVQEMEILSRYLLNTGSILKATSTKFSVNLTPNMSKMRVSEEGFLVNDETGVPQERNEEHWVVALQSKIAEGSKPVHDVHYSNENLLIKTNQAETNLDSLSPKTSLLPGISLDLGTSFKPATPSIIVEVSSSQDFQNVESIADIQFGSPQSFSSSFAGIYGATDSIGDLLTPVSTVSTASVLNAIGEFSSDMSLAAAITEIDKRDQPDTKLEIEELDSEQQSTTSVWSCDSAESYTPEEKLVPIPTNRSTSSLKSGKKPGETLLELIAKNSDVFRPLSPRIGGTLAAKKPCKPKPPKAGETWKSPHPNKFVESSLSMPVCSSPKEETIPSVDEKTEEDDEFLYIDLNNVLKALIVFCKDSSELRELPSEDDIIVGKLAKLKVPEKEEMAEYWHRFHKLITPPPRRLEGDGRPRKKKREMWNHLGILADEYEKDLKKRNQTILDMKKVYKENVELSRLLGQCYQPNLASRLSPPIPKATSYCQKSTT